MELFVTGGSGFIGGHLIEALVRRGDTVRALARSDAAPSVVTKYGARAVRAELTTVTADALAGADAVIHAAAFAADWGTRAQFWDGNVEGTTHLLAAARSASVRRFVHIGTEAALFAGRDLVDVDESAPYPTRRRYLYSETKAEAERRVLAAATADFEALSIRPRLVWGPRDTTVLGAIRKLAASGDFAWLDGGRARTSTTHVDNLVHALVLALTKGSSGRAYFVADDGDRSVREFLTALLRTQGIELGARDVPSAIARPLAHLVESTWRAFAIRRPPPRTRFAVDMMSSSVTVNTSRARSELGYAPTVTVEEGLARMAAVEARGGGG